MKIWKLEATLESEDDLTAGKLYELLKQLINHGDGIYVDEIKAKVVKKVKEEE